MALVKAVSAHPIDLDNGRTLAPGEWADDVDTDNAHNRDLVLDGHIKVAEGMKPRVRKLPDGSSFSGQHGGSELSHSDFEKGN